MFTKKKIIYFLLFLLIVASADIWIFSSIKDSYTKIINDNILETGKIIFSSVSDKTEDIDSWISNVENNYENIRIIYIKGLPQFEETTEFYKDKEFYEFYKSKLSDPIFEKGLESAVYSEYFLTDNMYSLDNSQYKIVFAPILTSEYDIVGIGIMFFNMEGYLKFYRLLNIFAVSIIMAFVLVYGIILFSRDPVMNFIILGLFVIVGIFTAYPLFEAVRLTFIKNGEFSMEIWKKILTTDQYLKAFWGSIKLGISTATLSTLIGFLFAFTLTRTSIKGKKFFSTMATLPVISPPFSLTLSILLLFGNNGLITKKILHLQNFSIYGLTGLTLVQTMGMFPIAYLTMAGILHAIDSTLEDAALDLNASKLKTFLTVTLPLSVPGILSAWLLVFTNSLADFANPLILSGNYRVLSVEAYLEVTGMNRLGNGAALSLLLLMPTITAFLVQRFWVSKKSFVTVTGKPSPRITELVSKTVKVTLVTLMVLIVVFLISLYGTIVAGCFVRNWGIDYTFTLENIKEALQRGKDAITDTVTLATIATPLAGILAMLTALILVRKNFKGKRIFEILIMAPFAIPGTLIGISYILAFNKPPLILVGTGAIIVINYIIRELPVGVEGGVAALRQIDPSIEEAAQDLGADVPTVFKTIVLPLLRPAFISSLSYTFVRSMTAVSAVIFLISAKWYHITVLIYNFSENLRFGLASVLATTLIIIVLIAFGLMRLIVRQSETLEKTVSGER
ncbi:ABC-type Fe3+ transport system, permease component [Marinitoga piezophila KA3]|uniref:ABC-type Fe3+ transport system, permease component n=1 Tax=Marinitoga piezophila (strain DSM 14283 / JCM 11233 / KA3) TaxID=443254 RepID=H2J5B4_MARPK|nr:iron ABC transporter permease [Marinitoga piezophila]AEX84972.1 ABC-type Fe3+ transport system, permease component [Marinitoga piezophila KA3]